MADPESSRYYRNQPDRLRGRDSIEVERELDEILVAQGGWSKDTSADANGVRYIDGKGGLVIINLGYPGTRFGARDAVHGGPYVKIMPGNLRIPLAGNPALKGDEL